MSLNRHIWEGWRVRDFIEHLEFSFRYEADKLQNESDVKKWCKNNQPYYKKSIPEVNQYFINIWRDQN